MINLLPTDDKREILAGRTNRILIRYVTLLGIFAAIVALVCGIMYLYLVSVQSSAEQRIEESNRQAADFKDKQKEVDEFRSNLNTIKDMLNKKVDYSTAILRFSNTVPKGVTIENLSLSLDQIGEPQIISGTAKTQASLFAMKDAFNESPYFSDAHFTFVTNTNKESGGATFSMSITPKKELFYGDSK